MRDVARLLMFATPCFAIDADIHSTLEAILTPSEIQVRRDAFDAFIEAPQKFVPLLKDCLAGFKEGPFDRGRLDIVLYLAAYTKDPTLAPTILDVFNRFLSSEEQESQLGCIYMCPCVFALVIFDACTEWELPELSKGADSIILDDARRDAEGFRVQSLLEQHATDHSSGAEAWTARLERVAKMSDRELLEAAGPENPDTQLRFAAALELHYRTVSSDHLDELYWLAITGEVFEREVNDASMQYREDICRAIYRAERAKQLGR